MPRLVEAKATITTTNSLVENCFMSNQTLPQPAAYVEREFNGQAIHQRGEDGYFDATAMCKATNKRWFNYYQLDSTKAFVDALSSKAGYPASELIQSLKGGPPQNQGTWVHPYIAINLAQWCSPQFAVQVSEWVFELMNTGKVEIETQVPRRPFFDFGYISLKWKSTFLTANVVNQYFEMGQCVSDSELKILTKRVSAVNIAVINLDAAIRGDSKLIPLFSDCCPSCGHELEGGAA